MSRRPRDASAGRRRLRVILVAVLAVALVTAGLVTWRAVSPSGQLTDPATLRTTATVTRTTERQTLTVNGTLAPRTAAYLSFPTTGEVTSVRVAVGEEVTKGDALAEIDDGDLRSAVTVARAEVEAAQEQLDQTLDDEEGSATVAAARAGLESAQQELRLARHNLDDATLRSTLDGVVAAVNVTEGAQSGQGAGATDPGTDPGIDPGLDPGLGAGPQPGPGSGAELGPSSGDDTASRAAAADIVVVEPGRWVVDVAINSSDIGLVKKGQPATVTPTGSSRALPAVVRTLGVIGSSGGGAVTFPATIGVRGTHDGLYIGGTAAVTLTVKVYENALTVPTAAIADTDGTTTVTRVVEGGEETVVPVRLGDTFGSRTQILAGLREGDRIVYVGPPER